MSKIPTIHIHITGSISMYDAVSIVNCAIKFNKDRRGVEQRTPVFTDSDETVKRIVESGGLTLGRDGSM